MNVNMKNLKEKFRKVEDWKGWKWGYSLEVSLIFIVSILCLIIIVNCYLYPYSGKIGSLDGIALSAFNLIALVGSYFMSKVLKIRYFYKFFLIPMVFIFLIILTSEIFSILFLNISILFN